MNRFTAGAAAGLAAISLACAIGRDPRQDIVDEIARLRADREGAIATVNRIIEDRNTAWDAAYDECLRLHAELVWNKPPYPFTPELAPREECEEHEAWKGPGLGRRWRDGFHGAAEATRDGLVEGEVDERLKEAERGLEAAGSDYDTLWDIAHELDRISNRYSSECLEDEFWTQRRRPRPARLPTCGRGYDGGFLPTWSRKHRKIGR